VDEEAGDSTQEQLSGQRDAMIAAMRPATDDDSVQPDGLRSVIVSESGEPIPRRARSGERSRR